MNWGKEHLNPVPRLRFRQHTTAPHRTQEVESLPTAGFPVWSLLSVNAFSVSPTSCWSPAQTQRHPYGLTSPLLLPGPYRFLHFWTSQGVTFCFHPMAHEGQFLACEIEGRISLILIQGQNITSREFIQGVRSQLPTLYKGRKP